MLVHHFLECSASKLPCKTALICGQERWTYEQIDTRAEELAVYFIALGAQRGDRVVLFLDNSPEAVIGMFASLKAGLIFVLLNSGMKAQKLGYILEDSGARFIIAQTSRQKILHDALSNINKVSSIIWCGNVKDEAETYSIKRNCILSKNWEEILVERSSSLPRVIDQDLATIIYTSGSTGEPKGVMSSHYNVVSAVKSISAYLKNTSEDIILNALPLSFDYGLYQIFMSFYVGGTVVLEKSFAYPYSVLKKIDRERVTGFPVVPTMAALFLNLRELDKHSFSSLRYITNTAATMPVKYIRKLQHDLPHVQIYCMYGLTECKRVSYLPPEYLHLKPESVGVPMPNCEVRVIKRNGEEACPDEVGELVIRGSNVMQGYWNDPEATGRVFGKGATRTDGWLYSGDLFRMDQDGFLYFVSRKDDMIKTKGERVSPKEVENVLCNMEGIVEAAVIGVRDDFLGQAVKAFLVTSSRSHVCESDVLKHCSKNLESFMVPKYIEFKRQLPKTLTNKIDKIALAHAIHQEEDVS